MRTRPVLAVAAALLVTACTGTGTAPEPVTSPTLAVPSPAGETAAAAASSRASDPLGAPGCRPPTPIRDLGGLGPELRGTATAGQLWGLVFEEPPFRVGDEIKIVWRMTGSGELRLTATAPDGKRTPLAWGPEPHFGSTYDRPGDEWGAGYRFTRAGCWTLHAARDDTVADVWLMVV